MASPGDRREAARRQRAANGWGSASPSTGGSAQLAPEVPKVSMNMFRTGALLGSFIGGLSLLAACSGAVPTFTGFGDGGAGSGSGGFQGGGVSSGSSGGSSGAGVRSSTSSSGGTSGVGSSGSGSSGSGATPGVCGACMTNADCQTNCRSTSYCCDTTALVNGFGTCYLSSVACAGALADGGSGSGGGSGAATGSVACGGALTCAPPNVCCAGLGGTGNRCVSQTTCSSMMGDVYLCGGAANCPGQICCVTFGAGANGGDLASCQATCGGGGMAQVCQSTAECPNGLR